jgi:hypothetical protein
MDVWIWIQKGAHKGEAPILSIHLELFPRHQVLRPNATWILS